MKESEKIEKILVSRKRDQKAVEYESFSNTNNIKRDQQGPIPQDLKRGLLNWKSEEELSPYRPENY